jgi:uncharacterized protein YjcR
MIGNCLWGVMTIKEIAGLCGVDTSTIRKWINNEKFLKGNFPLRNGIKEKLEQGSPERPSDFTLGETLEIIGVGGGNMTLASLLAENAMNKNALAVQNTQGASPFIAGFKEGLDRLDKRLERLEAVLSSSPKHIAIEDPQEKQYAAIRQFLVKNLNITGRRRDFVYLPDLWRRFIDVVKDVPLNMNALLFAVAKINLDGISVVNKGAFRGLHGCSLMSDDEY